MELEDALVLRGVVKRNHVYGDFFVRLVELIEVSDFVTQKFELVGDFLFGNTD